MAWYVFIETPWMFMAWYLFVQTGCVINYGVISLHRDITQVYGVIFVHRNKMHVYGVMYNLISETICMFMACYLNLFRETRCMFMTLYVTSCIFMAWYVFIKTLAADVVKETRYIWCVYGVICVHRDKVHVYGVMYILREAWCIFIAWYLYQFIEPRCILCRYMWQVASLWCDMYS